MNIYLNSKIKWALTLSFLLLGAVVFQPVQGAKYYVKPTGDDTKTGLDSLTNAWQHVQKGLAVAVAGDTVLIRAGTYNENSPYQSSGNRGNAGFAPKNSGSSGSYIVFKGYPGDALPVILGVNDPIGLNGRWVSDLAGKSYIIFDSLHFHYGWRGFNANGTHYITIRNCVIDSLMGTYDNNAAFTGVDAFNDSPGDVSNIIIEGCDISWVGKNGVWSYDQSGGIEMYNCQDMIFRKNAIHHTAKGIYLKGGTNSGDYAGPVAIYGNTLYDNLQGMELGNGGTYYGTIVYDNVFYHNEVAIGMSNPSNSNHYDRRATVLTWVYNNTIDCNGTGDALKSQSGDVDSCSFFNNIIYRPRWSPTNYGAAIGFKNTTGDLNLDTLWTFHPIAFYEDYNLFYGRSDSNYYVWGYRDAASPYTYHMQPYSLRTWRAASPAPPPGSVPAGQATHTSVLPGQATHTTEADPLFVDTAIHNYHITTSSPAASGGRGGIWPTYRGAYSPTSLTVTLAAFPSSLPVGGGTTNLTWTSTNADSVVIRNQATNQRISGSGPTNGSTSTALTATTAYVATAYKVPDTTTTQAIVTVGDIVPPATINDLH